MSSTQTYTVTGMTCDACVRHVSEELAALGGVSGVDVDLASGRVSLTTEQPVGSEQVRNAVEEAGYRLAS